MSSQIVIKKKRPKTIGAWFESRTPKQQSDSFRRARAQWGPKKTLPRKADDGPWTWPINLERYDRSPQLTSVETNMLTRYAEEYRFYRYGRTMNFGAALDRLVPGGPAGEREPVDLGVVADIDGKGRVKIKRPNGRSGRMIPA